VTAEAHRQRAIALVCEEVQEMFVPAPGGMPGPVNEKQWDLVLVPPVSFVNHFKHRPPSIPRRIVWGDLRSRYALDRLDSVDAGSIHLIRSTRRTRF
jgi:hypothetical protein